MDDNYKYNNKGRCPRCNGQLHMAEFTNIAYSYLYKDKLQCASCARVWAVLANSELALWY